MDRFRPEKRVRTAGYATHMGSLDLFSVPTRGWFEASFLAPTAAQEAGWEAIASGDHALIHAPTGSGKTLAAFLWAIDQLANEPTPPERGPMPGPVRVPTESPRV